MTQVAESSLIITSGKRAGELIERVAIEHFGDFVTLVRRNSRSGSNALRELALLVATPQPQVVRHCAMCGKKATHVIVYRGGRPRLNQDYVLCSAHAEQKHTVILHIGEVYRFLSPAAEIFPLSLGGMARAARYSGCSYPQAVEFLLGLCNFPSRLTDDNLCRFIYGREPDPPRYPIPNFN